MARQGRDEPFPSRHESRKKLCGIKGLTRSSLLNISRCLSQGWHRKCSHEQEPCHTGVSPSLASESGLLLFRGDETHDNNGEAMTELRMTTTSEVIPAHEAATARKEGTPSPLAVRHFGLTDRGQVRPTNEDQFLIATLLKALQVERTSLPQSKLQRSSDRSYLFVVADGMGGHSGGEQASSLAVDSVETFILEAFKWFAQCHGPEQDQVLADFQKALGHANARVLAEAAQHPELHGMGTTLTLAYSLNDVLFVAHVGDSRCYLRRGGALYRLTRDHTLVEELVRRGALSAQEAAQHHWRHVVTNAVGGDSVQVQVEVHRLQLKADDTVLLCSDGLTEMVAEAEINQVLQTEDDPEQACRQLLNRANQAGGKDNITVIVAQFVAAQQSITIPESG